MSSYSSISLLALPATWASRTLASLRAPVACNQGGGNDVTQGQTVQRHLLGGFLRFGGRSGLYFDVGSRGLHSSRELCPQVGKMTENGLDVLVVVAAERCFGGFLSLDDCLKIGNSAVSRSSVVGLG